MTIYNKHIHEVAADTLPQNEEILIKNCIIENLNLGFSTFQAEVVIEGCIINEMVLISAWFEQGFTFVNNIVKKQVQYEMGGHNMQPVRIENNIFLSIFVFFDCIFMSSLIIKNNLFLSDCTLWNATNDFNENEITGNTGKMDINRID
ncbi:MAG: hypothetical protein K6E67_08820 [Prevotella sp.]|nr:hypothetical protein [Prevotella sp.]